MRITLLEAIPYTLPVARIARFASGSRAIGDHVLVRVHTDEGIVGHAEAQPRPYTYGETQASVVAAVREHLAPAVTGLDPRATELVAEATVALRLESTVEDLIRTIHAHPTMAEAVGEAAHATHGAAIHS